MLHKQNWKKYEKKNLIYYELDEIREFELLLWLENIPLRNMTTQIVRLIVNFQDKLGKLRIDNYKIWKVELNTNPDKV